ncbi:coproporphyrinogen-III oxidase family protein [Candidatus Absconditicoccus praedator]|uniref:coproporphyrinogen-III oxidase family protein n=1 Tax=Candidatus Absconditicoccus praedator TaxID=2735562 RepID=UPI001E56C8BE|nr:radical SAM protein [Candidatus Absconditicoccus praedator]UFX83417.1 radical SAM protein [Candidatus Absconditicoccus praedator]
MLSLYIHVPFCEKKCSYCNFFVAPSEGFDNIQEYVHKYTDAVIENIHYYASHFGKQEIKTIYFGGGTPLYIGKENISKIIDSIKSNFNLEYLEEINFELNPNPFQETLEFIDFVNNRYKDFFRIRFSFGIQTFDDDILQQTGRGYVFNTLKLYLKDLVNHKKPNNVFNFDFIAFGKFNKDKNGKKIIWNYDKMEFFKNFVDSTFADSFSLYTLELFPGSQMFSNFQPNEENVFEEFDILKKIIQKGGYKRYEISNFTLPGKNSIHNMVYWDMGEYLGLGPGASSFLHKKNSSKIFEKDDNSKGVRFENTKSWEDFFEGNFIDERSLFSMQEHDFLIEEFFLSLRKSDGVANIHKFAPVLENGYEQKIIEYKNDSLAEYDGKIFYLKDGGMNLYNSIVTDLLN